MNIALVNTNRIKPAIAPIGLEYVAEALLSAGFSVDILDLCFSEDWVDTVTDFFTHKEYDLVGLTLRNTDDCAFTNRQSFIHDFSAIAAEVKSRSGALIVAGGVGFSAMPELILEHTEVDAGIWGDGEFAFVELAGRLQHKKEWHDITNLVWKSRGGWNINPPQFHPLEDLPPMSRKLVDNPRYFREGGQIGFETKRGCDGRCTYCADPVAKGNTIRCRPPEMVADELENLYNQGIDHLHTCDAEFNLPSWHAEDVCREIISRGLGEKLRWYAYCTPRSFSFKLAELMRRAGCVGINFGIDNGDARMLRLLKRGFTPDDISLCAQACRENGITTMFDLLLGSPGETEESITNTITLMKQTQPDRVGVSVGVRVYPGTEVAERIRKGELQEGLFGSVDPFDPPFFFEPAVESVISDLLEGLIGDDPRFLFFNPENPEKNYNYNANQVLVDAISKGYRGAYWDILRKVKG